MKIFILGATGYIGNHVARASRRMGHEVWGLTRSKDRANILMQNEIYPVIGSMQEPESYYKVAEEANVIIHAAIDNQDDTAKLEKQTIETLINISKNSLRPKTLIHTSGVMVYGNTNGITVDETSPLHPTKIREWRPPIENMVLKSPDVHGIVMRPGYVYGKQGGLTGRWFKSVEYNDRFKVIGDGNNHWAMIHIDDVADAYVHALGNGFSGEVFNITDGNPATITEIANAIARVADYKKNIIFISPDEVRNDLGDLADALSLDQLVDSNKARKMLKWQPKHSGFVNDVMTFFKAWKASQN